MERVGSGVSLVETASAREAQRPYRPARTGQEVAKILMVAVKGGWSDPGAPDGGNLPAVNRGHYHTFH